MQLLDAINESATRTAKRTRRFGQVLHTILVRPRPSPDTPAGYAIEVWLESKRFNEYPVPSLDAVIPTIRQLQHAVGLLEFDPTDDGWKPYVGPLPNAHRAIG